ncbi:NAD(P)H-quinone oxidoreductase [Chondromyces crocatus]|uniref:NAD(P)H quinone oxidoreductase n=1 Tax=Chondromyces crocatus TaxID=52 RepID=A0A0K1E860_CHOCO|nr:NAD(P)H-quinone oxidoreductase [Chondromyces crocatus]AKT37050.1 NAD(P)H quinone oxidoreductase [Chondromyces crocatus]
MRAMVIRAPGGPEVLELREVAEPEVPHGHVRIAVRYAGVNRADLLQRAGHYPPPPGVPPDVPGLEYAGVIDAVGPGASRFAPGARVYGLVGGGAYAEKIVVHEREVSPTPTDITDEQASAIPEAFVTAYDALVHRGRLSAGEQVLIHAAGSGVGTAAVQIAHAIGAFVIGTSRTQDKLQRATSLGLDVGIVPRDGRFADEVLHATGKGGVDVVLDLVGGGYVAENVRACASKARIILVGLTGGARTEIDLREVLRRRLEIIGTVLRSRPLEEKIEAAKQLTRPIGTWLAAKRIQPIIDRVFPLEEAAQAHKLLEENLPFGKVLLRVDR